MTVSASFLPVSLMVVSASILIFRVQVRNEYENYRYPFQF